MCKNLDLVLAMWSDAFEIYLQERAECNGKERFWFGFLSYVDPLRGPSLPRLPTNQYLLLYNNIIKTYACGVSALHVFITKQQQPGCLANSIPGATRNAR